MYIWVVKTRDADSKTHVGVRKEIDGGIRYDALCGSHIYGNQRFKADSSRVSCARCIQLSS